MTIPLIFFGDHPAAHTGLARDVRDLATRTHDNLSDTFRVATLGHGSPGSSRLPFPQYQWRERDDFLPLELQHIVRDFCADDPFILLTVGDIQRFLALADPHFCREPQMASFLRDMRSTGRMQLWSYFPIDSHNREGKLGHQLAHTLTHYDRRLVPSEWARKIVERTLPNHSCEAIPHGIDTSIFYPHTRNESRDQFGLRLASVMKWPTTAIDIPDDALWIGVVATNQNRKDWGLAVEVVHEMKKSRPVVLWAHTDAIKREWSILELLSDFGLLASSIATVGNVSDEVMAQSYSAMDITLGIGRGEGFGYPIAESLACGVPCISGSYGAQSDFLPRSMQVDPQLLRIENDLNLVRPLYGIEDWVRTIESLLPTDSCEQSLLPMDLDWVNLWPRFAQWFKDGVK